MFAVGCVDTTPDPWGGPDGPREPYQYRLPDGRTAVGTGVRIGNLLLISGDIMIPADQAMNAAGDKGGPASAAVTWNTWPSKTIVYQFTGGVSAATQAAVISAAQPWTAAGFRFRQRTTENVYLEITTQATQFDFVCASMVGFTPFTPNTNNPNKYWAAPNCRTHDFVHEWGHVLGLFHEHERMDRDQFVRVNTDRLPGRVADKGGMDWGGYDFGSIMHYDAYDRFPNGVINRAVVLIDPVDGRDRESFGFNETPSGQDMFTVQQLYWSETPCGPGTGHICP